MAVANSTLPWEERIIRPRRRKTKRGEWVDCKRTTSIYMMLYGIKAPRKRVYKTKLDKIDSAAWWGDIKILEERIKNAIPGSHPDNHRLFKPKGNFSCAEASWVAYSLTVNAPTKLIPRILCETVWDHFGYFVRVETRVTERGYLDPFKKLLVKEAAFDHFTYTALRG